MTTSVAKAFNSRSRRFAVGDPISILDDVEPFTFEDLKARQFIVTKRDPAPIAEVVEVETPARRAK